MNPNTTTEKVFQETNALDVPDDVSTNSNDTELSMAITEHSDRVSEKPTASERFKMVSFLPTWNTSRKNIVDLEKSKVLRHFTLEDYRELMYSNRCYVEYFGKRSISTKIRPYFDIDIAVDALPDLDGINELLMHHIQMMSRILTELFMVNRDLTLDDFAVSSSHGLDIKNQEISKMKVSFHVVVIGHCMTLYDSLGDVITSNQLTKGHNGYWFDPSVYKEDEQCWRNVGMVKEDEKHSEGARVMVPVNHQDQLELHFPSYLVGNELPIPKVRKDNVLSGTKLGGKPSASHKKAAPTKVSLIPEVVVAPESVWEESSDSDDDDLFGVDSDSDDSVQEEPQWCETDIRLDPKLEKKISDGIMKLLQKYPGHEQVSYDNKHSIKQKGDRFSISTYWKSNGCKRRCPSGIQHDHGRNNFYVNISVTTGDIFYACMPDVKECGDKSVKILTLPEKTLMKLVEDINSKSSVEVNTGEVGPERAIKPTSGAILRADDMRADFELKVYTKRDGQTDQPIDDLLRKNVNRKISIKMLEHKSSKYCLHFHDMSEKKSRKCPNNKYHPLHDSKEPDFSVYVDEKDLNSVYYQCNATCKPLFLGYLDTETIIEDKVERLREKYLHPERLQNEFDPDECEELVVEIAKLEFKNVLQPLFAEYISKWWTYVKHGENYSLIRSDYEDNRVFMDYDITKAEKVHLTFDFLDDHKPADANQSWNIVRNWYLKRNKKYKTRIVWAPNGCGKRDFNTFVEPSYIHLAKVDIDEMDAESQRLGTDGLQVVNHHILEIMCNGSNKTFELFTNWMAHQVQNGVNRKFNCNTLVPLFYGERGIGKGLIIIEFIAKFLFGGVDKHQRWCQIQTVEELKSKFNSNTVKKLFIVFDDLDTFEKEKKIWAVLRNLYGNSTQRAELKYFDSSMLAHVANYCGLSNDINCTRIATDERNSWLIPCASKKKVSREHISRLLKNINEITAAHWLHWLLKKDITNYDPFDFNKSIHKNSLFKTMQQKNIPPLCMYLQRMVENHREENDRIVVNPTDLVRQYTEYLIDLDLPVHERHEYAINTNNIKSNLIKYIDNFQTNRTQALRTYIFSKQQIKDTLKFKNYWEDDCLSDDE